MTHHLSGEDLSFTKNWYNIILTRDPQKAIISFSKVISNPTMEDLGYKLQYDLANYFISKNINFKIILSENLLKNPFKMLIDLCDFSEIKFHSKMLSWKREELQKMVSGQNIGIKMHNSNSFSPWEISPMK